MISPVRTYVKGAGLLVGLIFGAGVFALPFVIAKAGFFWGITHFFIAGVLVFVLHLFYSRIICSVETKHRFTGYAQLILGERAKQIAFFLIVGSFYGSLLAYGVLGGIFLSNLFSLSAAGAGVSVFWFSILFFLSCGFLLFLNANKIATINFYLLIPLLGFLVYLFFVCWPHININNFHFFNGSSVFSLGWFLPYGVWVFALAGFEAIPEARDLFGADSAKRHLKKLIIISSVFIAVLYWLFIISILGVSGSLTSEDAFSGIAGTVGAGILSVGSLIGFLAVFTSFLVLAENLIAIFVFDFKINKLLAWFAMLLPPVLLFSLGFQNLGAILGAVGAFGLGGMGALVVLMHRKQHPNGTRKGEFVIALAILTAVVYEILNML